MRVQMIVPKTVELPSVSLAYQAGNFYMIDDEQALAWIWSGAALDAEVPPPVCAACGEPLIRAMEEIPLPELQALHDAERHSDQPEPEPELAEPLAELDPENPAVAGLLGKRSVELVEVARRLGIADPDVKTASADGKPRKADWVRAILHARGEL